MIAKPIISPDFTIEDIHKIREYHYELSKDMTSQEGIFGFTYIPEQTCRYIIKMLCENARLRTKRS